MKIKIYKNYDLNFNERQTQIIQGCILGDSSFSKIKNPNNNVSMSCQHCEKQKKWLEWKHEQLRPFCSEIFRKKLIGRKRLKTGKVINDETKNYIEYGFNTQRHPVLTELEKQWYKRDEYGNYILKSFGTKQKRIKIIPSNFYLTELTLAVWFIDDGLNCHSRKFQQICTDSFTENEVNYLIKQIENFGIKSYRDVNNRITINNTSYVKFSELIKSQLSDLPEELHYKIKS